MAYMVCLKRSVFLPTPSKCMYCKYDGCNKSSQNNSISVVFFMYSNFFLPTDMKKS